MAEAKEILSPKDYSNYRNVRAAAILFIVLGSIFGLGGLGAATDKSPDPKESDSPVFNIALAVVGLAGVVGGIAALQGNRRWAKLAYVMAVPYLLAFPLGTIMGYVVLTGLSRYLDSKEQVSRAIDGVLSPARELELVTEIEAIDD